MRSSQNATLARHSAIFLASLRVMMMADRRSIKFTRRPAQTSTPTVLGMDTDQGPPPPTVVGSTPLRPAIPPQPALRAQDSPAAGATPPAGGGRAWRDSTCAGTAAAPPNSLAPAHQPARTRN